jgi:hypothetical protein
MTYTINGKQYTEFDINVRCAKLMGAKHHIEQEDTVHPYLYSEFLNEEIDYCNLAQDTDAIIDKCWDELMVGRSDCLIEWNHLIKKHNCTKLTAACICLIELNE